MKHIRIPSKKSWDLLTIANIETRQAIISIFQR